MERPVDLSLLEVTMTRFTAFVLIASLFLAPLASAAPQATLSISTAPDSILKPIHTAVAWLARFFKPPVGKASGVPEGAIALPDDTPQEYGAEIIPNG
jgi:hypothetical protein